MFVPHSQWHDASDAINDRVYEDFRNGHITATDAISNLISIFFFHAYVDEVINYIIVSARGNADIDEEELTEIVQDTFRDVPLFTGALELERKRYINGVKNGTIYIDYNSVLSSILFGALTCIDDTLLVFLREVYSFNNSSVYDIIKGTSRDVDGYHDYVPSLGPNVLNEILRNITNIVTDMRSSDIYLRGYARAHPHSRVGRIGVRLALPLWRNVVREEAYMFRTGYYKKSVQERVETYIKTYGQSILKYVNGRAGLNFRFDRLIANVRFIAMYPLDRIRRVGHLWRYVLLEAIVNALLNMSVKYKGSKFRLMGLPNVVLPAVRNTVMNTIVDTIIDIQSSEGYAQGYSDVLHLLPAASRHNLDEMPVDLMR